MKDSGSPLTRSLAYLNHAEAEVKEMAEVTTYTFLPKSCKEVLEHLVKDGPVWDGDIICKSSRSKLIEWGLAVRCCHKGNSGYQVATVMGLNVFNCPKGYVE